MKKVYEKPQIVFENFTMTTNIAGGCEKIVGGPTEGTCGIEGSAPGQTIFSSKVDACDMPWDDPLFNPGVDADPNNGDMYDGFCYHVPTQAYNFFNS